MKNSVRLWGTRQCCLGTTTYSYNVYIYIFHLPGGEGSPQTSLHHAAQLGNPTGSKARGDTQQR